MTALLIAATFVASVVAFLNWLSARNHATQASLWRALCVEAIDAVEEIASDLAAANRAAEQYAAQAGMAREDADWLSEYAEEARGRCLPDLTEMRLERRVGDLLREAL